MSADIKKNETLAIDTKIDPTQFDVTVCALLIGLGAEKYIDIFKKHNIGQCTLMELSEEDLIKLGVDESEIRQKIIKEVQNLPIYEESAPSCVGETINIGAIEIVDILEESAQHLHRIGLSMLANRLAMKQTKKVTDCLLFRDKYGSDIALATLSEMNLLLNSIESALDTQLKIGGEKSNRLRTKKIVVGTIGSAAIAVLTILFLKSLKNLS